MKVPLEMSDPDAVRLAIDLLRVEVPFARVGVTYDGCGWPTFRFSVMRNTDEKAVTQISEALEVLLAAAHENGLAVDDGFRASCAVCRRWAPLVAGECPDCRH